MISEKNIKQISNIILKLIYPDNLNCIICNMPISRKNKYSICRPCMEKIMFIHESCVKCGKPTDKNDEENKKYSEACGYCKDKRFLFDRNISFLEYGDISKKIVFKLKYYNKTYIAKIAAEIIYDSMKKYEREELEMADFITFVPLSEKRIRIRGFNQAEKIAYYLSLLTDIEEKNILKRNRDTKKLYGIKSSGRKKELAGAFSIIDSEKENIYGKRIIVVDDIFTTGATMDEIAKTLKLCGVKRVVSLTLLTGKYDK